MSKVILVIDRHADELSIQELLDFYGRKVIIAEDEEEAIKILKRENVALILMEPLINPSMLVSGSLGVEKKNLHIGAAGLVLFRNLKNFNVPIYFHTLIDKNDLHKAGFPEEIIYYQKPFPIEDLVSAINNLN